MEIKVKIVRGEQHTEHLTLQGVRKQNKYKLCRKLCGEAPWEDGSRSQATIADSLWGIVEVLLKTGPLQN